MQSYYEESLKNSAFPFALTVQQGNTPYGYHWHDEFEISCVLSGHVAVHVGKKQYRLEPGDLLLIPGTVPHCFSPSDPAAARLAVKFGLALLPAAARLEYSRHGGFAPHSVQWPPQTARRFRDILQRLRCEYTGVKPGYQTAIGLLLLQIFLLILREVPARTGEPEVFFGEEITQALTFLSEHYQENITLRDCAEAAGYSESYLSRLFRQKSGVTFHAYLQNLRLSKAEWMLAYTDAPVTEIAGLSGFMNSKTFYRAFRAKWKLSPLTYRGAQADAPPPGASATPVQDAESPSFTAIRIPATDNPDHFTKNNQINQQRRTLQ